MGFDPLTQEHYLPHETLGAVKNLKFEKFQHSLPSLLLF